ncbi:835_t:CDS:1 [Paraglomus occultum]|uniref:835_t:CDS:1 n=1 Tax=Paraglomus occultum TaxID=144539 RepID=A0A9N9FVY5_9GLOM|nr:835_t:CDS:1 [Paraglomus occultum]
MSVKYVYLLPLFLHMICRFGKDLIFGFMAVNRKYVKSSTYWFVFGPLIVAFCIGVGLFIFTLKTSDELDEWERTLERMDDKVIEEERNIKRKMFIKVFGRKFRRAVWIVGFCSQLMFCLVVAPSVLWIKLYLTLGFIAFTMLNISIALQCKMEKSEIERKTGTNQEEISVKICQ